MPQRISPKAEAALRLYCHLGRERSLRKLADELKDQYTGKKETLLRQLADWSTKYSWVAAAAAFDAEQDQVILQEMRRKRRQREEQREKDRERMDDEHALLARSTAIKMISTMNDLITKGRWNAASTAMMFKIATDLERVARGGATEAVEQQHTGELRIRIETDQRSVDATVFEPQSMERFINPEPLTITLEDADDEDETTD